MSESGRASLRPSPREAAHPVELHDLDERIRSGELAGDAELRHPPWTGEGFRRLDAVAELAEAFDAPAARLHAHFRRRPLPWASTLLTGLVLVVGLLQLVLPFFPANPVTLGLAAAYGANTSGFEPIVLDGHWWSSWGSQFVHGDAFHLFPNLAVLGYCGYRVERLLGPRGHFLVAASSVAVGILLVTLFQRLPVIGSSVLGFGFWGAQLALGFRFGDHIPPRQQRFYGYGNLAFFAFLFASTLTQPNTSHWGHIGGFLGGVLAAGLARPGHVVPAARAAAATLKLGVAGWLVAMVPLTYGWVLPHFPSLIWWPTQTVELEQVGASLYVPGRLLPEPMQDGTQPAYGRSVRKMPAWTTSDNSPEFVFCGIEKVRWELAKSGDPLSDELLAGQWGRSIAGEARVVAAPPARGPGWTAHALEFVDDQGHARYRLVEHHLLRGRVLNRVGYVVSLDHPVRQPLFEEIVAGVRVGEPPELARARDAHLRSGTSERARLELARALYDVGDFEQADGLFALVIDGGGRLVAEGVLDRLDMWAAHPERFVLSGDAWFGEWLADFPSDRALQQDGIDVLAADGRCGEARFFHEAFAAARPDAAELVHTASAVMACEARLPEE